MDRLWAPWRLAYVTVASLPAPKGDDCFICRGLSQENDRDNLIALRTSQSVVILNRFPYNNGHLLVAPRSHKGELQQLSDDEILDTTHTLRRMLDLLKRAMKPDGFNIGLNLGQVAGAGLPGHLHWHIVPRWSGDTNFMPIFTDAKVISQSLDALYDLIAAELAQEG